MDQGGEFTGRPVPAGRMTRALRLGGIATSIAGSAALKGAQAALTGSGFDARASVLTPATAQRLADGLAGMRGAAMKLGQLLSMEMGDLLPAEFSAILARLRAQADPMPPRQLKRALTEAWGPDFLRRFRRFEVRPIAAASIGQVHRAELQDGRVLAIKVQYPGIRRSIDSDLDNVATLIRWSGILPETADLTPLLAEAKRQLHEEADYTQEAAAMAAFNVLLADDRDFRLPAPVAELTTGEVLAMDFIPGVPIESLATGPEADRNRAAELLLALALREFFDFGLMQTDPNFANYRWDPATRQVVLLDFGAVRRFSADTQASYRALLAAGLAGDRDGLAASGQEAGFLAPGLPADYTATVLDIVELTFGPLRQRGPFDFAQADLPAQVRAKGEALAADRQVAHLPPADLLYLQRKAAGLYLLAAQLGAQVDLHRLFAARLPG